MLDIQKSVQSYQTQQTSQAFSEISSQQGSWNGEAAHNRSLDLKRLRAENAAMGNALAASLQILRSELAEAGRTPSKPAEASFATIHHITDVLKGIKSSFDTSVADTLVGTATTASTALGSDDIKQIHRQVIAPKPPAPNLLDESSPTLVSEQFMPMTKGTFSYPVAPRRTPSIQSSPSIQQGPPLDLPPKPSQTHYAVGHPTASVDIPFPDLGDWQNVPPLSSDPLTKSTLLPRQPAHIRSMRGMDSGRQALQGGLQLDAIRPSSQLSPSRQHTESMDPLGALF